MIIALLLAQISISHAVWIVFGLIIISLIFGLLWWLIDYCEIREPFNKLARVLLAILAVFVCISILLSLLTNTPIFKP